MKKIMLLFAAIILGSGIVSAQITVNIPEVTPTSAGSTVTVPVNAANFNGIGAITLKISYDPAVLQFQGSPNPLPGNCVINASNGNIVIGWYSLNPLNIGTAKLLDLNFTYVSGASNLNFVVADCDIADSTSKPLTVTYQNGKVNSCEPASAKASIGDKVWLDSNKNGIQDAGENGLQWVTVELFDCAGAWKAWASTDANGQFKFSDLEPGDYFLKAYLIDNYKDYNFTTKNAGGNPALDSDAEALTDSSAKTACVTLSSGENDLTIDFGVIDDAAPPVNTCGSIGDFVWKDLNSNNLQDAGEPGIAGVTVKLVDCNNFSVLRTATTGSDGKYLFDSLTAGGYAVQFTAPSGYQFVSRNVGGDESKDSDADNIHGRTDCITVAAGENYTKADCGFSLIVVPPTGTPVLVLTKSDGKVTMPDSGSSTTYTINYENTGNGALYNAIIVDSLPDGVSFEAASDGGTEVPSGSGFVQFYLTQLDPAEKGFVTVKVKVTSHESEYLNTAWLIGKDSKNEVYCKQAQDLNFCDTTSSGGGSGVESRGDMAELLLRREWKMRNGLTTPVLSKSKMNSIASNYTLRQIVPAYGPFSSYSVETTPFDILGISNAVESYAVDYKVLTPEGDRRVGGVFSTITVAPGIYDHTKAVCDRLAGSAIEEIKLVDVNSRYFYAAKLRKSTGNITDYAISFSVYETASGYYVENKWTYGEYKAPAGATSVYNFQAWSSSYEGAVQIAKAILANIAQRGSLSYLNNSQADPSLFIKNTAYTHDGKVHLTFINNSSSSADVTLSTYVRYSQGDDLVKSTSSFTIQPGESTLEIPVGIVSDAQVEIKLAGGFTDEVFVSGGAYTYISGSQSTINDFRTNGYAQINTGAYPYGTLLLSGGAYTSGSLKDWVTVVRALTTNGTPYNLHNYGQVRFEAAGTGTLTVFFDAVNVKNFNYFAKNIALSASPREYIIDFSEFRQLYSSDADFDASQIRAIGFIYNTANNPANSSFNFEVKNIGFITNEAADVNDGGSVVTKFDMAQNYPNPFNPTTRIEFQVAVKEMISLKVFDVLGQQVADLVNGELTPGRYTVNFDASALASGVYFYKLHGASVNITRKMTLTK